MAYTPKSKIKALGAALLSYAKEADQAGVHIPELEALRPFFGKKGQILIRPTRSKKQQEKLEAAIKAAKEKYGARPNKAKIKKELEKRKQEEAKKRKKAEKTYRQRKVKEAKEKQANFRSAAQKAARQYNKVVDVLMNVSLRKLLEAYGIGSDLVEYLAEQDMSVEDIKKFIKEVAATVDDVPEEARALIGSDRILGTLKEIRETYDEQDFNTISDIFKFSMEHPEAQTEEVERIINTWRAAGGETLISFADLAEQLNNAVDPFNTDTLAEILEAAAEEDVQ